MSVKVLSRSKEIRDLIRTARSQGWWVKKLKNNHLRWIPPKGPFVHSSAMINHQGVLAKIKHDLEQAGLILEPIYMEKPKPFSVESIPEEAKKILQEEQVPPPEPEPQVQVVPTVTQPVEENMPRKISGRGDLRAAIIGYMKKRYPTNLSAQQVYEGIRSEVPRTSKDSVNSGLANLVPKGILERVRPGVYKWNPNSVEAEAEKPHRKRTTIAEASSELAKLQQALDTIMEAASTIEKIIGDVGDKLKVVEQMQKLFGK